MSRARAADIAALLVNQGFQTSVIPEPHGSVDDGWSIQVQVDGGITAAVVAAFAVAQALTATVKHVELT